MFGLNLTILASALAGIAGFGLAWQLRAGTIESMKLEQANERIAIQRAARAAIDRATVQITRAQTESATRAIALRADADAARGELDRLRDATATVRTPADDAAACADRTAAIGKLLNQCAAAYQELGERADRHVNDIRTLTAAWERQ